MRNILVTGGSGFIGSNLASSLVEQGYHVRILHRRGSDTSLLQGIDVERAEGDVRDKGSLRVAIKGCDTVFHTAALISYWRKERPSMLEINVGGSRNVAEVCQELGVERLIHTSSTSAIGYPENGNVADETNVYNWAPYDVGYRISKHLAEQEIQRGISAGLNAVIVNPSVVIGPGDVHFRGGQLIRDVAAKRIFYYIDGEMNIAHVSDIVRGHILAAQYGRPGERYILCGEGLSRREVISTIAEVVGGIKPFFRMPMPAVRFITGAAEGAATLLNKRPWVTRELLAGSHMTYHFSCMKAQTELGYTFTPFREAVQKTFDWYKMTGLL